MTAAVLCRQPWASHYVVAATKAFKVQWNLSGPFSPYPSLPRAARLHRHLVSSIPVPSIWFSFSSFSPSHTSPFLFSLLFQVSLSSCPGISSLLSFARTLVLALSLSMYMRIHIHFQPRFQGRVHLLSLCIYLSSQPRTFCPICPLWFFLTP